MGKKKQEGVKGNSDSKNVSLMLLESYRKSLYSIRDFLERTSTDLANIDDIELQLKISLGITTLGKGLGPAIESLDSLEEKVKRDEKESITRTGQAETSLFEVPKV